MASSKQTFDDLLSTVAKENASDLHLSVGRHPTLRVDGQLTPLVTHEIITQAYVEGFISLLLTTAQKARFLEEKELDLSYTFRDRARFRVNLYHERGYMSAALRLITTKVRTLEELMIPPILAEFTKFQQGFLLITGPTGHGKSTTLAALVDLINHTRTDHILTIEDPIEYLFTSDRSTINQREIGIDTIDFHRALKSLFREDVNVAMVGEMRDAETMRTAVTAAETGHLILSTLHTNTAAQTIDRIIDTFPPVQQQQIRAQLAATLIGIVSQRLIPRISGGLIPAVEILTATSAVRNLIRENKVYEIDLVIETSADQGMMSLNRALVDLVRQGEISMEDALLYTTKPDEFNALIRG